MEAWLDIGQLAFPTRSECRSFRENLGLWPASLDIARETILDAYPPAEHCSRGCQDAAEFIVTGDGYPDFELYYYDGSGRLRKVLQVKNAAHALAEDEGGRYLLPGPDDWTARFHVGMPWRRGG